MGLATTRRLGCLYAIDYLEGDSVIRCCKANAHKWRGCIVRAGIDNTSFENSLEAGRSKVPRLNDLIRRLLALQIEHEFILEPYWISSGDNLHADLLSRQKIEEFLEVAHEFVPPNVPLSEHASAGTCNLCDCDYTVAMGALRQTLKTSPVITPDGPSSLLLSFYFLTLGVSARRRAWAAAHLLSILMTGLCLR